MSLLKEQKRSRQWCELQPRLPSVFVQPWQGTYSSPSDSWSMNMSCLWYVLATFAEEMAQAPTLAPLCHDRLSIEFTPIRTEIILQYSIFQVAADTAAAPEVGCRFVMFMWRSWKVQAAFEHTRLNTFAVARGNDLQDILKACLQVQVLATLKFDWSTTRQAGDLIAKVDHELDQSQCKACCLSCLWFVVHVMCSSVAWDCLGEFIFWEAFPSCLFRWFDPGGKVEQKETEWTMKSNEMNGKSPETMKRNSDSVSWEDWRTPLQEGSWAHGSEDLETRRRIFKAA